MFLPPILRVRGLQSLEVVDGRSGVSPEIEIRVIDHLEGGKKPVRGGLSTSAVLVLVEKELRKAGCYH